MIADSNAAYSTHTLWSQSFRLFFTGRVIDLAGSAMTPVALSLSVLQATRSASDVGWVMAANVLPGLVFMLAGGVLADRWNRSRILFISAVCSGLVQAIMATLLITGRYSLTSMAILSAIAGVVSGFNAPALRGIVPELVASADVQKANGALATARNATRIGGPLLAGVLVTTIGGGWALALDAASFLAAAACFRALPHTSRPTPRTGMWQDLADGWATFRSLRWVWTLSIAYALINLLSVGPWQVLGPSIISEHHGLAVWGMILSVRALGLLLASTVMMQVTFSNPLVAGLLIGPTYGLPLVVLSLTANPVLVAAATIVGAVGITVSGITYEATLQTKVTSDKLSRVSSYDELFSFLSVPISQAVVGPLATKFDAHHLVMAAGIGIMAAYLLPLLSPEVRHAGTTSGS